MSVKTKTKKGPPKRESIMPTFTSSTTPKKTKVTSWLKQSAAPFLKQSAKRAGYTTAGPAPARKQAQHSKPAPKPKVQVEAKATPKPVGMGPRSRAVVQNTKSKTSPVGRTTQSLLRPNNNFYKHGSVSHFQ
jgi:hypothetical protein